MAELFLANKTFIIFFHVISAVVWVGGMIAIKVAVHPVMHEIEDEKVMVEKTLSITGNLFNFVFPFIVILFLCAIVFFKIGFSGWIIYLKFAIFTIMALNYCYMYIQRFRALRLFKKGDLAGSKNISKDLPHKLLPLNILLGIIAIFLGVLLGGF